MKSSLLKLSLLFLLLISLIYFFSETDSELDSAMKDRISSILEPNDLTRIRLTGLLGSYDLNKSASLKGNNPVLTRSEWVLREPLYAPVKDERMQELITLLLNFSGEKLNASEFDDTNLKDYGLIPPALVVILNHGEDQKEVWSVGSMNEVTKRLFIRKEGSKEVYLTDADIFKKLQVLLTSIRSEQVLNFDASAINKVDVIRGEDFFRLVKDCDESKEKINKKWNLVGEGFTVSADNDLIARELKELTELRVARIFDNPLDILQFTGLAKPALIFKVSFEHKKDLMCGLDRQNPSTDLIFQIGKGFSDFSNKTKEKSKLDSVYYLKIVGENVIYAIDKGTFGDWFQTIDHFRDKTPLKHFNSENFDKLELLVPDKKCVSLVQPKKLSNLKELGSALKSVEVDLYVSKQGLSNFRPSNGLKLTFRNEKCNEGLEVIGDLVQDLDSPEVKSVAKVVHILKCDEPELYAVVSDMNLEKISLAAHKACI